MSAAVASQTRVPRVVAVLALSIFVLGTSEFMITGLLPEMARDLAVSIPQTGYLISAFAIGMIVGAPVMAVVTLAMPRRTTLVASLVVFVAGHVLAALASDYAVVLVARVLTALATATFWVVAAVVAVSMVGEHLRARALAVLLSGLTIATVLGIPLGTVVGQQLGWRATFWSVAGLALLAVVGVLATVTRRADGAPRPVLRDELAVFGRGRLWLALVAAPRGARVFQLAGAAPTLASAANTAAFNVGNTLGPVAGGIAITAGYGYAAPS